jgi:monoamine oxidase
MLAGGAWAALGAPGCGADDDTIAEETADDVTSDRPVVPRPTGMVRSAWAGDPFALGAYSAMVVGADPTLRAVLAEPVDGRIFLAGEATSTDHPATVHGARASGLRAAEQVLALTEPGELVVVLGAGIAGLSAARALVDAGVDVVVVEARERMGGRLHTVRPEGWPVPVDVGASWVHDVDAGDLLDLLDEAGIAGAAFEYDDAVVLGPDGPADPAELLADALAALEDAVTAAADLDTDVSVAEAMVAILDPGVLDLALVDHLLETEVAGEYAESATALSAWWAFEEGGEGDDVLVLGGYDGIASALAEGLAVELGRPVVEVARSDDGVRLTDGAGATIDADRVVVTLPLGVLQAGSVAFAPPLPAAHADAIARLGVGLLDKLWLRFDEAFWSEEAVVWSRVAPPGTPFRWWVNLLPLTGEPVLLAVHGGETARAWADRSDVEVLAAATETLQAFLDAGW